MWHDSSRFWRTNLLRWQAAIIGQSGGLQAFGNSLGTRLDDRCIFARVQVDPDQTRLAAEPGHLPLGELPRAHLDKFNRVWKRAFAAQVFDDLAVSDRLHGGAIVCQSSLEQLPRLGHQSVAKHGIDADVNAGLEIRGFASEAEKSRRFAGGS